MMSWNYRLVKKSIGESNHFAYGIHEVYYGDDETPWGITEDPVNMSADHLNELKIQWDMLIEAFGRPVIDYDEFCKAADEAGPHAIPGMPTTDEEWGELIENSRPLDEIVEELGEELGMEDHDPEAFAAEMQLQNEKEELQHDAEFIGESPEHIHSLIKTLRSQSP